MRRFRIRLLPRSRRYKAELRRAAVIRDAKRRLRIRSNGDNRK